MAKIQDKLKFSIDKKKLPPLCPLECVVVMHMVQIISDGKYAEISIMDIYSLMNCYSDCSDELNSQHTKEYKCECVKYFNKKKTNNGEYDSIRKSITDHHNKIKQVEIIYNNYKKKVEEYFGKETFKYNIFHSSVLKGNNSNFKISAPLLLIANSKNNVINFTIKPQLNKLNLYDVVIELLFQEYFIRNTNEISPNYDKFYNKNIIHCIFTLDSEAPIFIDFKESDETIKICIKEYLYNKYTDLHKIIIRFYNYCSNKKPNNRNSIQYTIEKLLGQDINNNLPQYIYDYFHDIQRDLENSTSSRNEILKKIKNEERFMEELNKYLKKAIEQYFSDDVSYAGTDF